MAAATDPLAVRLTSYVPNRPHPPQHAFLWLNCKEALYGGAAGGGKTDALLAAALQYVDIPGYHALLLRRTFTELERNLIARSKEWLSGTDARWNEQRKRWIFPSGARLQFGFLEKRDDHLQYQGDEYQFIGFDELTQFTETQYRYLFSRLRKPSEGSLSSVPLRMRSASNPGGPGHRWVKERFKPGSIAESPERVFIPAKLDDNPSVDRDTYEKALAELDEQTRAQLRDGDWNARQPGLWVYDQEGVDAAERLGLLLDQLRQTDKLPPPEGQAIQLGIDWGLGMTAALVIWPLPGGGIYIPPGEVIAERGEPSSLTRLMLDAAAVYDFPLDEARYDSAGGQQMATFAAVAPESVGIYGVAFAKRKKRTIGFLRELFRRTAQGKDHRVIAISPENTVLLNQLRDLRLDDRPHREGEVVKENDHAPDALIAGAWPIAAEFPDMTIAPDVEETRPSWASS